MKWARSKHRWVEAGVAITATAALAGCASIAPVTTPVADQLQESAHDFMEATRMSPPGVDPASPIAADALKAEHVDGPIPSFAAVPPKVNDLRPAGAYKSEVVALVADKRGVNQWSAANPPGVFDTKATEGYAAVQRQRVGNDAPVTPQKQGETESFVKKGHQAVGQTEPAPTKSAN